MAQPSDELKKKLAAFRDSVDYEDDEISQVLDNSAVPKPAKGIVGIMAVFPKAHRVAAFVILSALILGAIALGGVQLVQWLLPAK